MEGGRKAAGRGRHVGRLVFPVPSHGRTRTRTRARSEDEVEGEDEDEGEDKDQDKDEDQDARAARDFRIGCSEGFARFSFSGRFTRALPLRACEGLAPSGPKRRTS